MSIKLEQIDLLRERAHVSYEDAKEALERCNYDSVEALIYLEREKKIKPERNTYSGNDFYGKVKSVIKKGNDTKFIVKKNENVVVNLPVTVVVISTIIFPPITIVGVLGALATNHKIRFRSATGEVSEVNNIFDKMSSTVSNISTALCKEENIKN